MKKVLLAMIGSLMLANVGHAESTTDKMAVGVKEAAYSIVDKSAYTVNFDKNSTKMSQSSVNSLKALFNSLEGELRGAQVMVGSWSDKKFPIDANVKLSEHDSKLAKERADKVADAIKKLGVTSNIQTINFGEQNNFLEKMFKAPADGPEVKEALQTGTTDSRRIAAVAKRMQDDGGPGKVVVMVLRETSAVN